MTRAASADLGQHAVRFWDKVNTDGPEHPTLGRCWEWTGGSYQGYARFSMGRLSKRAHRVLFEAVKGPIPPGLTLDHLCRNTICVRPSHLEAVTNEVNLLRGNGVGAVNAAKTHCCHGHLLAGDNLHTERDKGARFRRRCITCARDQWARKWRKQKERLAALREESK